MKRVKSLLLVIIIALTMVLGLTGCDGEGEKDLYVEPTVKSSMKWEEKLPLMRFGEPADTIDFIDIRDLNDEIKLLLASLKGVVNSTEPRIYTQESINNWTQDLETDVNVYTDGFKLVEKYKAEIKYVVIYDKTMEHTINLACTYAGIKGECLVVSEMMYSKLLSLDLELEIAADYRGKFTTAVEVYTYLYNNYWSQLTHRVITCLNPRMVSYVRDYAIAVKSALVWLDIQNMTEKALLEKFLVDMPAGESAYMGWFPEGNEALAIALSSKYGLLTYPSDYCENLMFFAATRADIVIPEIPDKPTLQNKVYVAMGVSEGDNLQYMQHRMKTLWDNPLHGTFPVAWTISPSSYVALSGILGWYYENANDNVSFLTGPSGIAYNYPRAWSNREAVKKVFRLTNEYCQLAGIKVVNNWSDGDGWRNALTAAECDEFASEYTSFLALYDQSSKDASIHSGLLVRGLDIPYTSKNDLSFAPVIESAVEQFILGGRTEPTFLTLIGNPWQDNMYEAMFKVYQDALANFGADVEFVRIDHIAMLEREHLGLPALR